MNSPIGKPVKSPLIGLEMTPETATYVGILEAQLAAYAINEAKYRALLELLTDEPWDTTKVDVDGKLLMDIATDALVRRGMDRVKAKVTVNKRWNNHNAEIVPTPTSAPIDQTLPAEMNAPLVDPVPMKERLADWKGRRAAEAAESSVPTSTEQAEPIV